MQSYNILLIQKQNFHYFNSPKPFGNYSDRRQ